METVKNQLFQDHHIPPNMETVKNLFLSRPPHQPKVETVKNQLFQDHHIHPNMETVRNLSFQDHHTNQK